MKRFEKILFAYSIVAVTAVLITFGLYSPSPQNLISSLLLAPIALYFWLKITSPQEVNVSKWSLRLVAIVAILTALGVYGSFLSRFLGNSGSEALELAKAESQEKIASLEEEIKILREEKEGNQALQDELAEIKDELARLSAEGKLTLGTSQSSLSDILSNIEEGNELTSGYVSIKSSLIKELDVLEEPDFAAKRVGTIVYGETYPFSEKSGSWFKISLPDEISGWVHERDVTIATSP